MHGLLAQSGVVKRKEGASVTATITEIRQNVVVVVDYNYAAKPSFLLESNIAGWSASAKEVGVADRIGGASNEIPGITMVSTRDLVTRAQRYRALGAQQYTVDVNWGWGLPGPAVWALSQALWDADAPKTAKEYRDDFLSRAFGPAETAARKYYDARYKNLAKCRDARAVTGTPADCATDTAVLDAIAKAETKLSDKVTANCPGLLVAQTDLGLACKGALTVSDVVDCVTDDVQGPAESFAPRLKCKTPAPYTVVTTPGPVPSTTAVGEWAATQAASGGAVKLREEAPVILP